MPKTGENIYKRKDGRWEMGIEEVNFHALRHTFATRCVESASM